MKRLVWLDTILCDAETDFDIVDRYFNRFMNTLHAVGCLTIPEDTELQFTIYVSRDKTAHIEKVGDAVQRLPPSVRSATRVHLYEHPASGYNVPPGAHVDRIKNPNKQSGRREALFRSAFGEQDLTQYSSVVRISMDDDDVFLPHHLEQLCHVADALLVLDPTHASAAGLYRCYLGVVSEQGALLQHVEFNRVIPGNKFFVIPPAQYGHIASFSPGAIPELIDEEAVAAFKNRHINLTLVRNNEPTFVYMRRQLNLSNQSKEHFIDSRLDSQSYRNETELLGAIAEVTRRPVSEQWVFNPLPRVFVMKCWRASSGDIEVQTNFSRRFGPDAAIAYYLLKDGERMDARWYSRADTASFPGAPENCIVKAFVRSEGNVVDRLQSPHPV